jgi:hypothetical protein
MRHFRVKHADMTSSSAKPASGSRFVPRALSGAGADGDLRRINITRLLPARLFLPPLEGRHEDPGYNQSLGRPVVAPSQRCASPKRRDSSCVLWLSAIAVGDRCRTSRTSRTTSDLTRRVGSLYDVAGHGVAQIRQKANDSYRAQLR